MSEKQSRNIPFSEASVRALLPERWDASIVDSLFLYAKILSTTGVQRGLIGPKEPERLWERHLLNSAALTDLLSKGQMVLDLGTGGGLPGIVIAIIRPDLDVHLLEPMARRVTFLQETVSTLALSNCTVHHGRANGQRVAGTPLVDVVVARAVAPLGRLIPLALPLLRRDGRLLAMKGDAASTEIAEAAGVLTDAGVKPPQILYCGEGIVSPLVRVVEVVRRPTRDHQ